jgi:hypothetical protein
MELTKTQENRMAQTDPTALSAEEQKFLSELLDPLNAGDLPYLSAQGAKCGLRPDDVAYVCEWVLNQGCHWLSCQESGLSEVEGARIFRNPKVRRIINGAAKLGLCNGTSALKEEIEDYFSQRLRNPFMPEALRDNAASQLAKLKGYYPKEDNGGKGGAVVQINITNPYADSIEIEGKEV